MLEVPRRVEAARPALHRHRQSFGQLVGEVSPSLVSLVGLVSLVSLVTLERPMRVRKSESYPLSRG